MRSRGLVSVRSPADRAGRFASSRALRRVPIPLRAAALMPPAALAVHQLRYLLAYGPHASQELAAQGHSYLPSLTPWLILLLALSLGAFVGRLAHTWQGGADIEPRWRRQHLVWVWLAVAAVLILIYASQEFLEGLFASGHPGGLVGVFGNGGLWAIPSALAVAALLALLLRGAEEAIARLAARTPFAFPVAPEPPRMAPRPRHIRLSPIDPLASAAAGRAPPSASLSLF